MCSHTFFNTESSTSMDTQNSILSSVQQEITARRQHKITTKHDSRHSVKSLIENIEGNKVKNYKLHSPIKQLHEQGSTFSAESHFYL